MLWEKKVVLVDSAKEVAREVKKYLDDNNKRNRSKKKSRHKFLISDRPQEFKKIAKKFLGHELKTIVKV